MGRRWAGSGSGAAEAMELNRSRGLWIMVSWLPPFTAQLVVKLYYRISASPRVLRQRVIELTEVPKLCGQFNMGKINAQQYVDLISPTYYYSAASVPFEPWQTTTH